MGIRIIERPTEHKFKKLNEEYNCFNCGKSLFFGIIKEQRY